MLQDLRALQIEVKDFRARLRELNNIYVQNISSIDSRITKELTTLESSMAPHQVISSNTPDLIRIWRLARSLPGLYAFNAIYHSFTRRKEEALTVDIVYRKGHAWIFRNSIKFRALVSELINIPMDEMEEDEVFSTQALSRSRIVGLVRRYIEVANNNLKLGAVPQITIFFPRLIEECRDEEDVGNVQKVFDYLAELGVSCITEIGPPLSFDINVGRQIKDDFGNEEVELGEDEPVQLDLTTLFVLVSDISNVALNELDITHTSLEFQMQEEARIQCLRERIFPIIQKRPMLCTRIAYERFVEIVSELGSPYEKQRAGILFDQNGLSNAHEALSAVSIHAWPEVQVPVRIQEYNPTNIPLNADFKTRLAKDCFDCAWNHQLLVLTANMVAAKTFRESLFMWPDDVQPKPRVYLHAARSLTQYARPKHPGRKPLDIELEDQ